MPSSQQTWHISVLLDIFLVNNWIFHHFPRRKRFGKFIVQSLDSWHRQMVAVIVDQRSLRGTNSVEGIKQCKYMFSLGGISLLSYISLIISHCLGVGNFFEPCQNHFLIFFWGTLMMNIFDVFGPKDGRCAAAVYSIYHNMFLAWHHMLHGCVFLLTKNGVEIAKKLVKFIIPPVLLGVSCHSPSHSGIFTLSNGRIWTIDRIGLK